MENATELGLSTGIASIIFFGILSIVLRNDLENVGDQSLLHNEIENYESTGDDHTDHTQGSNLESESYKNNLPTAKILDIANTLPFEFTIISHKVVPSPTTLFPNPYSIESTNHSSNPPLLQNKMNLFTTEINYCDETLSLAMPRCSVTEDAIEIVSAEAERLAKLSLVKTDYSHIDVIIEKPAKWEELSMEDDVEIAESGNIRGIKICEPESEIQSPRTQYSDSTTPRSELSVSDKFGGADIDISGDSWASPEHRHRSSSSESMSLDPSTPSEPNGDHWNVPVTPANFCLGLESHDDWGEIWIRSGYDDASPLSKGYVHLISLLHTYNLFNRCKPLLLDICKLVYRYAYCIIWSDYCNNNIFRNS